MYVMLPSVGLCIFSVGMMVFAAGLFIQYRRQRDELHTASDYLGHCRAELATWMRKFQGADEAAATSFRERLQISEAELKSTEAELNKAHGDLAQLREELDGAERVARDAEAQLSQFTADLRTLLNRFTETTKSAGG